LSSGALALISPNPSDSKRNRRSVTARERPARATETYRTLLEFSPMPKTLIQNVVQQLDRERIRLQTELSKVSAALTAFGRVYLEGTKSRKVRGKRHTISAAGRKRIAAAQRARWARVKKGKRKKS